MSAEAASTGRYSSSDPNWANAPKPRETRSVPFAQYAAQQRAAADDMKALLGVYKRFAEENGMEIMQVQDDLTLIPLRNGNVVHTTETGCVPTNDVHFFDVPKSRLGRVVSAEPTTQSVPRNKAAELWTAYGGGSFAGDYREGVTGFTRKGVIL